MTAALGSQLLDEDLPPKAVGLVVGAILLAVGGVTALSTLRWWRFRFWIEDGQLRATEGGLSKREVDIPLEKIHALEEKTPLLYRPLGLTVLEVKTAAAGTQLHLSAVRKADAAWLRHQIAAGGANVAYEEGAAQQEGGWQLRPAEIAVAALTSERFVGGADGGTLGVDQVLVRAPAVAGPGVRQAVVRLRGALHLEGRGHRRGAVDPRSRGSGLGGDLALYPGDVSQLPRDAARDSDPDPAWGDGDAAGGGPGWARPGCGARPEAGAVAAGVCPGAGPRDRARRGEGSHHPAPPVCASTRLAAADAGLVARAPVGRAYRLRAAEGVARLRAPRSVAPLARVSPSS